MASVDLSERRNFDVGLRKFRRACEKEGILSRLREIKYHEKDTTKKKRRKAAAIKRHLKTLQKQREALMKDRGRH